MIWYLKRRCILYLNVLTDLSIHSSCSYSTVCVIFFDVSATYALSGSYAGGVI